VSARRAGRRASVAKVTKPELPRRPLGHFEAMDALNQALRELSVTAQALDNQTDDDDCRVALMRLLMLDVGLVRAAEREAWRVVVKGGAA
jgi:hypothetical protein